jgi:CRP-like cAMP-binding protein
MRFLDRLDEQYRDELLALSQITELPRGHMLVQQGERSDDLYLIQSGRLEIVDTRSTPEVILSTVGPGSLIGELSFFDSDMRSVDVRAINRVRCHQWSGAALKRELAAKPALAAQIYHAMAGLIAERARGMTAVALDHSNRSHIEDGEDLQQQAHTLASPSRTTWIAAERALRLDPNDSIARQQIRTGVEHLFQAAVRWITGKGEPHMEQAAGEALSRELHPFLTRSRMGGLSLDGSNTRRMAHILLNERRGVGPLGEQIDQVLLSLPTSVAFRRRTTLAGQTMLSRMPDRWLSLMVINVFSGVVLNRLFQRLARYGADVTCLDSDREALASVDLGQSNLPSTIRLKLVKTDLAMLCMGQTQDPYPPQDFILVDGLIDYLPNQLAAGLLAWCRDRLKPGGQVLLTGTSPSNDAPLFDHLLDWPMIRRPARDLRAIADSVGLRGAVVAGGEQSKVPAVVVTASKPG